MREIKSPWEQDFVCLAFGLAIFTSSRQALQVFVTQAQVHRERMLTDTFLLPVSCSPASSLCPQSPLYSVCLAHSAPLPRAFVLGLALLFADTSVWGLRCILGIWFLVRELVALREMSWWGPSGDRKGGEAYSGRVSH